MHDSKYGIVASSRRIVIGYIYTQV